MDKAKEEQKVGIENSKIGGKRTKFLKGRSRGEFY